MNRSFQFLALVFAAPLALLHAEEPNSMPVEIELLAGAHDRQDTPVAFDLPKSCQAWKGFQLVDPATGGPVQVQFEPSPSPRLVWIVDGPLKAGTVKRYRLAETADAPEAPPRVSVTRDEQAVRVEVDHHPVLQYNVGVVPSDDPKEPAYARSGFIHPVYDPTGQVVTEGMPPDHMHQHGIFFAWVNTTFEGRQVDFWNSATHEGLVRHVELVSTSSGPVCGSFVAKLDHVDLKAPGGEKVALHETWVVRIYRHQAGFLFDLQSTQNCAGPSALQINKYHYGGMAVRGARNWFPSKAAFLTSEGKDLKTGNATRARWCEMSGPLTEHVSGIAVLGSPGNFDAPQPLRLHPDKPYFCWAPMVSGPFSIEPGKPYVSAYRFFIHKGEPDPAVNDALWADFAEPPTVRVVP